MQITSMLSAGYLEPVQNVSRVQNVNQIKEEVDQSKQAKEQEILAEEQALKAKLGNSAQVHTVYHYTMGTDGRRYITGASVTMKGSEEDLNRVSGGVATEDLQTKQQEVRGSQRKEDQKNEDTQNIIKSEADKREARKEDAKSENEKDAQIRELKQTEREVIAHEAAHQAAAGEFGGGVSYTYTKGPDGKSYITGVPPTLPLIRRDRTARLPPKPPQWPLKPARKCLKRTKSQDTHRQLRRVRLFSRP